MFREGLAAGSSVAAHGQHAHTGPRRQWRERLRQHANPRADAAAWTLITALPAHPIITVPVAVAATGRTKPAVANAIEQMEAAGILARLTQSARNRAWEAEGLLDLIVGLESGAT